MRQKNRGKRKTMLMCTKKRKGEIKFASQKNEHDFFTGKIKFCTRGANREESNHHCVFVIIKKEKYRNRNMKEGRKKFLYGEMERRVAKRDQ